jgi:hypothetical protein
MSQTSETPTTTIVYYEVIEYYVATCGFARFSIKTEQLYDYKGSKKNFYKKCS